MIDFDKVKKSDLWYVVGYIASDGYLVNDGRHINITSNLHNQWCLRIFSGSFILINWLFEKIQAEFKIKGRLYLFRRIDRDNPHYVIKFGKKAAKTTINDIYYPSSLSLHRKLIQSNLCLQDSGKMVDYTGVPR